MPVFPKPSIALAQFKMTFDPPAWTTRLSRHPSPRLNLSSWQPKFIQQHLTYVNLLFEKVAYRRHDDINVVHCHVLSDRKAQQLRVAAVDKKVLVSLAK